MVRAARGSGQAPWRGNRRERGRSWSAPVSPEYTIPSFQFVPSLAFRDFRHRLMLADPPRERRPVAQFGAYPFSRAPNGERIHPETLRTGIAVRAGQFHRYANALG